MRASRLRPAAALLALTCTAATAVAADDPNAETAKLRDQLRTTTLALRDAQDQNAALTAKTTELTASLAAAQKQIDDLKTKTAAAPAAPAADDAALKDAEDKLRATQVNLGKWQAAYKQAADVARDRAGAAKQLGFEVKRVSAGLADCTAKNGKLEAVGMDLLDKLQSGQFDDFIGSHEPFTQIYRVKIENIVQDYQDKMRDQKVVPR